MIARIVSGAVLGAVIGYERDRHGRPVGLRTHLLVALTSATFMVVSSQFAYYQHFAQGEGIEVDASRIAASVVSGIGFLAGGAILRTGLSVQGLTTAAGLWLVTAIGLCAGAGMYVESVAATAVGITALWLLRRLEDKDDHVASRRVTVVFGDEAEGDSMARIMDVVSKLGATVRDVEYSRRLDTKKRTTLTFDVKLPLRVTMGELVDTIERHPGVKRVSVVFSR
ncbi:MgtC/SapB family protein [Pendulispora brunnea]|uniref:MgtC/SapB family protein n=1 Tax=Pendulispora brunnea TaxID=2905690 RepID=A0ABZ2JX42_9BACT